MSIDEGELVSICVPAYNSGNTIGKTLRSIISQSYQNLEIIIVENASTDDTLCVIEGFKDKRIKLYRNESTITAEDNFNRCIELAKGDFVAIFHADDVYEPDMVEKQLATFKRHPQVGAVFVSGNVINYKDEVVGELLMPEELRDREVFSMADIFISILKYENFLICPTAMLKGDLYKQLSPYRSHLFKTSSDLDLWMRVLKQYPIAVLSEKLINYRVVNSHTGARHNYNHTEQAHFFMVMDFYLSTEMEKIGTIPPQALDEYEFARLLDTIMRSLNHIHLGESNKALEILKHSIKIGHFRYALLHPEKPMRMGCLLSGVILLILTQMGLERRPCKFLNHLRVRYRCGSLKDFRPLDV